MTAPAPSGGGSVRPSAALAFATIAFVALLIFGLGMLSLTLDEDVIAVPGLGQFPGILGVALSTLAFAVALWVGIRRPRASYATAGVTAVAAFVGYLAGVWLGALFAGPDLAAATSAVAGVATSWFGLVLAATGFVAGWGGVALVRTRAARPRWPWEGDAGDGEP